MNEFMKNIDAELRRKASDSDRDHSYLHPSAFGGCPVEIWMKASGIDPDFVSQKPQDTRVFDEGHFLHLRYQLYTRDAGILAKDKIVSRSLEKIEFGGKIHDRFVIVGASGRTYPYDLDDHLWPATDPDPCGPKVAGMLLPEYTSAHQMQIGDEFWLVEIPLMDTEYHFGGHADLICLDRGEEIVVDFKSKSEFTFARLWYNYDERNSYQMGAMDKHLATCHICGETMKEAKAFIPHLESSHPNWTHVDRAYRVQLQIYMWLLNTKRSLLVHENKSSQAVHVQEVERDEDLIGRIKRNAKVMWQKIQDGERPMIPGEYGGRTKFPCGWCDYASKCWS